MATKRMRKKVVPKHLLGTLLNTGIGLATSAIGNAKVKREAERVRMNQEQSQRGLELSQDQQELDAYESSGKGTVNYYQAKGGKLSTGMRSPSYKTRGGKLKPLSSDMEKAYGNKHGESKIDGTSGIKLAKGGKTLAEIEDGETIKDGQMVYSDRTKVKGDMTYADAATKLSTKKATLELQMKNQDSISMATSKRKLAMLDKKENMLFMHQEGRKMKKGAMGMKMPKMRKGGRLTDRDEYIKKGKFGLPYIDDNEDGRIKKRMLYKKQIKVKPDSATHKQMRNGGALHPNPTSTRNSGRFSDYPLRSGNRALDDYLAYDNAGSSSRRSLRQPASVADDASNAVKLDKALMMKKGAYGMMMGKKPMGRKKAMMMKKPMMKRSMKKPMMKMAKGGMMNRKMMNMSKTGMPEDMMQMMMEYGGKMPMGGKMMKKRKGMMNYGGKMNYMATGGMVKKKTLTNKMQNGGGIKAFGKKVGKGLTAAAPFLDNISNAILTSQTPNIPKPRLQRIKDLETTTNVNPQLAEISSAVDATTRNVSQNTSNSNVARANVASARLKGASAKSRILANKDNTERNLRNANTQNRQRVESANLNKLGQYDQQRLAREGDIQGRISANVSNFAGDITDIENRKREDAYNKERLDIAKLTYNQGTTKRAEEALDAGRIEEEDNVRSRRLRRKIKTRKGFKKASFNPNVNKNLGTLIS